METEIVKQMLFNSVVKKYVEKGSEIPKEDLIRRCYGNMPDALLQRLKQLIFYRIGKNSQGELYLF